MTQMDNGSRVESVPEERPAYAPNKLDPIDEEARKSNHMDESAMDDDGIDWDELITTLDDDFKAERFTFISTNPNQVEAFAALEQHLNGILEKVLHGGAAVSGAKA